MQLEMREVQSRKMAMGKGRRHSVTFFFPAATLGPVARCVCVSLDKNMAPNSRLLEDLYLLYLDDTGEANTSLLSVTVEL